MFTIQFLGAAGQVTGSKYFLRTSKHRGVMLDCGLFQGTRDLTDLNWNPLPIDISDVHNIVLTHAHLDHTGYLPRLGMGGFGGQIYSTPATQDVSAIILRDSAHLQQEDAEQANRHPHGHHTPARALYGPEDAEQIIGRFVTQERHNKKVLPDDLSFEYFNAGHILGSCFVLIEKRFDDRAPIRILFSGDLGREFPLYLKPREDPPQADIVVCESTYGDRFHSKDNPQDEFAAIVEEIVKDGKVLLVPAFAVDRAQELIFCLNNLMRDGKIPPIPTYVDSPMATSVTQLYEKYSDEHTMSKAELGEPDHNPLSFDSLHFTSTPDQSKALNKLSGPAIIISAGGMATGGRIMHHLQNRLNDPSTIVLFTGFQGEGTLGRQLIDGATHASVLGVQVEVKAQIRKLLSMSGHSDQGELMSWLKKMPAPPKHIFLTHGEDSARTVFKGVIEKELGWTVHLPTLNHTEDLTALA